MLLRRPLSPTVVTALPWGMSFFGRLFGAQESGPGSMRGTARVIAAGRPPPHATWANLGATLVVEVPGMAAFQAEYRKLNCRIDKWPAPGTVLPVTIDPRTPGEVTVLWDEVPTGAQAGHDQAARLAELLNNPGRATGAGAGHPPPGHPPPDPPFQPPATVNVVAGRADGDPVTRLEKLAGLRDMGIVTDEQFQQLRAQILRQAGLGEDG